MRRSDVDIAPGSAEESALVTLAAWARGYAYAPYAHTACGAAVVADDTRTFHGSSIENASLGLSLCAERAAISSAVCAGVRRILAVVVVSAADPPALPCGACLQWIAEFGGPSTMIISAAVSGKVRRLHLRDLYKEP